VRRPVLESVITLDRNRAAAMSLKVTVHILPTRKETKRLTLDEGATVDAAIRKLGLYPDQWIPLRDDVPLPLDEPLKDGDVLKLIAVVSGG
jgi:sulfur carrier protein ThiS